MEQLPLISSTITFVEIIQPFGKGFAHKALFKTLNCSGHPFPAVKSAADIHCSVPKVIRAREYVNCSNVQCQLAAVSTKFEEQGIMPTCTNMQSD